MPSEDFGAGWGGYKLPGLDPGSVVKANLQIKVVSHQESVASKDLEIVGFRAES